MSNVAIKITADVVDMQAKFAVAKAESQALNSELNKLARQGAQAGGQMSAELRQGLIQAAEAATRAKAEVTALGSELKNSQGHSQIFNQSLGIMKEGFAALGITASIGALVEFGKIVEENAAHIAHQAQVLQLSVTGYQAFQQAAIDTGVDTATADMAIQRFSKSVSEAAVGTGPAAKALVEMGISASQSKEQILQQVSAFLEHTDAVTRDRYATELFGRSGAEMIPLFSQWAQGADALTNKFQAMGRILDPETAEAAEKADEKLHSAWEHFKVEAAPAVVFLTEKLADLVDMLGRVRVGAAGLNTVNIGPLGFSLAGNGTSEPAKPYVIPKKTGPSEADEVAALNAIDGKMRERIDLEKELAIARKTAGDAKAAGDSKGLAQANEVIADLKKQLDSLNRPEADPAARKAAEERRREMHEIEQEAKQMSSELDAEARSDAQRDVTLAKQTFDQKKELIADEFTEHRITAQQKYDQTVEALNKEAQAEIAAQQQIMDSSATTAAQKHEAANQEVEIEAEKNAKIAELYKQLTEDKKAEDRREFESRRQMISELETAEDSFVSDVLTKRQSLALDLEQVGARFVESEIENLVKVLTEHELMNLGIIASDTARTQAGFLATLLGLGQQTSATVAAEGAKTAATTAGATTRAATEATAVTAGKVAESTANVASAESYAAVAAAGAAASQAFIPIIGPELAAAAAATTFASLQGFVTMAALAKGTNFVPTDMVAQIHAGERVIPAADNAKLMSAIGAGGGAGSGGDMHLHYSPTINAPRERSLSQHLETDGVAMRDWFQDQVNDGYIKFGRG